MIAVISLSDTNDLQQAHINDCSSSGTINITGIFAENSDAMGYFVILCNESGIPEDFQAVIGPLSNYELFTSISNVPKGNFIVDMFDIEGENGLPSTLAAIQLSVEVLDGSDEPQGMSIITDN